MCIRDSIMIMYDSLNRHLLEPYGCDWTKTPNFARLARRAVTFDNCWAGSLPCMPARRELHTGRYNFLHRSWGPLEPDVYKRQTVLFITHNIEEAVYMGQRIMVLTNKPTSIKCSIDNDLPRPRDIADPDFVALRNKVTDLIKWW